MSYAHTRNIGNEIQSIAARKFLPKVDYFIEHEDLNNFNAEEKIKTIMNAWYLDTYTSWPPSDSIDPLLISMHINLNDEKTIKAFLSEQSREFLLKNGPVGARSLSTVNFLNENDIPSYFSGCLTLTLDKNPNIQNKDYIVTVDVPDEVISFLKTKTNKKIYNITHLFPVDVTLSSFKQLSTLYNQNEKFSIAEDLLNLYQSASCVITNRLHAALPSLALNTPVLLLNNYKFDKERFSGLIDLMHNTNIDEYFSNYNIFDVENPPSNKNDYLKIRKNLNDKCEKFTSYKNENSRNGLKNIEFYLSLLQKTSVSVNKYTYRNNYILNDSKNKLNSANKTINDQNATIKYKNTKIKTLKKQKKREINKIYSSKSWKATKIFRDIKRFFK